VNGPSVSIGKGKYSEYVQEAERSPFDDLRGLLLLFVVVNFELNPYAELPRVDAWDHLFLEDSERHEATGLQ
jgi:hypothetical protein